MIKISDTKDYAREEIVLVDELYNLRYSHYFNDENVQSGIVKFPVVITSSLFLPERNVFLVYNLHLSCMHASLMF